MRRRLSAAGDSMDAARRHATQTAALDQKVPLSAPRKGRASPPIAEASAPVEAAQQQLQDALKVVKALARTKAGLPFANPVHKVLGWRRLLHLYYLACFTITRNCH